MTTATPGLVEIDLVAHDGDVASGEDCCTLTMIDVATGSTVNRSVPNRARRWELRLGALQRQILHHTGNAKPRPAEPEKTREGTTPPEPEVHG